MNRPILLLLLQSFPALVGAQTGDSDFAGRRQALFDSVPDGLVILNSEWEQKPWAQDGFRQAADFYYFTGLENQIGALLLLDGPRRESTLFLPDAAAGLPSPGEALEIGEATADRLLVTRVLSITAFIPFLDNRLTEEPVARFYAGGMTGRAAVPGLSHFHNPDVAFREALSARWPDQEMIAADWKILGLRSIKSPREIQTMRVASEAASAALLTGLKGLQPGRTQREVEVEVAATCYVHGSDGVSWWPWIQTGPNAVFPHTFASFADYRHLNREMEAGELARLDIGCEYGHYDSDVGRTAPVSGTWTEEQGEAWDLLIAGYRGGLEAIRDGVAIDSVRAAFEEAVRRRVPNLRTDLAREASGILLDRAQSPFWQIHGVGLEPAEPVGSVLREGMVVAFEPMFSVRGLGYFLEDLLVVTESGYELLTPGLPYTADEIEHAMRK